MINRLRYAKAQLVLAGLLTIIPTLATRAEEASRLLIPHMVPLRSLESREWAEFPEQIGNSSLRLTFAADPKQDWTLQLRQLDVKQGWNVLLNGQKLGALERNENAQIATFAIPQKLLQTAGNLLAVEPAGHRSSDDIAIGQVRLIPYPPSQALTKATIEVQVVDDESGQSVPARITLTHLDGTLAAVGNQSTAGTAVRTGVLYTLSGAAKIKTMAGDYRVYATRGFEWSVAEQTISLQPGTADPVQLRIRRVVPTEGWVASDTHVHTLTFSGHGDSSIEERMATLAGEGIELPIATDHNVHINYTSYAKRLGADKYFTPVIGNEVTTKIGHFNIFPVVDGAETPDHTAATWDQIFENIFKTPNVQIAIFNHARDVHSGFRPFGPENHIAIAGENYLGWTVQANAMELINSGATQTNPYQLFHDWLGLLNRGHAIAPIGCSDSHDVARHFVGQARTYVRVDDRDPGQLSLEDAVRSFREGRVSVSYGLFSKILVNDQFAAGDLVPTKGTHTEVTVDVLGPAWVRAERVRLFANGRLVGSEQIDPKKGQAAGLKWTAHWRIPNPRHDFHLVAIADGPGVTAPYWPMAKAYQPTSIEWESRARAITGAVWVDGDKNGQRDSAQTYAQRLVQQHTNDLPNLLAALDAYDAPIAIQVASRLRQGGTSPLDATLNKALSNASEKVRDAFAEYRDAWRETVRATSR